MPRGYRGAADLADALEEFDEYETITDNPVSLCRHFDFEGRLLYVGISLSALTRLAQHRRESYWYDHIARVEIEHFETREEALEAEAEAIRHEKPLHNIAGQVAAIVAV
jgi:hypothetical protein